MEISLHDNWIYSHSVDHDSRVIVLHTVFPHSDPQEYTDVIFEDVLIHHFETQRMTTNPPFPSNVLFDIEEEEASVTLDRYSDLVLSKRNYSWPMGGWKDLDELARLLAAQGHRCFHIHGTVGLDGFVFARDMLLKPRSDRWTAKAE